MKFLNKLSTFNIILVRVTKFRKTWTQKLFSVSRCWSRRRGWRCSSSCRRWSSRCRWKSGHDLWVHRICSYLPFAKRQCRQSLIRRLTQMFALNHFFFKKLANIQVNKKLANFIIYILINHYVKIDKEKLCFK